MSLVFVHLSDIHFGQEKGGIVFIHTDVRERLLDDAGDFVRNTDLKVDGIIITGDLAYGGSIQEYEMAGKFLDALAERVGCPKTAAQVIPGNHDIHRPNISSATRWMLEKISAEGEAALDRFLATEQDREVLYNRLRHYRKFAEGYDCPLDGDGGVAGYKRFEIEPGKFVNFIGLNSALSCGEDDEAGRLLLGAKQWVLPRTRGEELVVLCHHPLHWFRDSADALRYVRSRARVFISGHEHDPSFNLEEIETGCDLLMLAAGATTPPKETADYTFTYNFIRFDWISESQGLKVEVYPRIWSSAGTCFLENDSLKGSENNPAVLACPNFRTKAGRASVKPDTSTYDMRGLSLLPTEMITEEKAEAPSMEDDGFALELLRFFRDLTGAQRLAVLIKVGALPADWSEPLNHSAERRALDLMRTSGRTNQLKDIIDSVTGVPKTGES